MQSIPLEPGMRVRCVDKHGIWLNRVDKYTVTYAFGDDVYLQGEGSFPFRRDRFKPIIRVKMRAKPSLDILLARALRTFDKMSPTEKDAHIRAQRESWVRGFVGMPD
jgi:hypothetical protein